MYTTDVEYFIMDGKEILESRGYAKFQQYMELALTKTPSLAFSPHSYWTTMKHRVFCSSTLV